MSKKTKWVTVVRNGDLIKLGDVKIQVNRNRLGQTSLTVEVPQETHITKQELADDGKQKLS